MSSTAVARLLPAVLAGEPRHEELSTIPQSFPCLSLAREAAPVLAALQSEWLETQGCPGSHSPVLAAVGSQCQAGVGAEE